MTQPTPTYQHYTTPAGRSWRLEVDGDHAEAQVPHTPHTSGTVTRDGWEALYSVELPLSPEEARQMGAEIDAQLGEEILCGICLECVGDAQVDADATRLLAAHHAGHPRCASAAAAL